MCARTRSRRPAWHRRAAALLALACSGCLPGYVRVTLQLQHDSNDGRPLRVLVRHVEEQQYRGESYAGVAALVITPDKSVLKSWLIEPAAQSSRAFWVRSSKEQPLGVYFFYAGSTAGWKLWLPPALPWRITIPLGRTGVDAEHVRECRVFRN